ncbi:MAG: Mut7-C ubiquitin/RNAse domain-containing protein [Okeania sp. SIO3B3]|nr:Mut7-C ubiquitin/RNAse domain-containing protein [Okeania sp. SIO3B3]
MNTLVETYSIFFRFFEELNDFLPEGKREVEFSYQCKANKLNIKDIIESLGVPHTEIDVILVNGKPVDFTYSIQADDSIAVYPINHLSNKDITKKVSPEPLEEKRFVLDVHLGKLAKYLRLVGFDTLYRNDYDDPELAEISQNENRILLTKDRNLLKRKIVKHGYCVRSNDSQVQLLEIVNRFDLKKSINRKKGRCLTCNTILEKVKKEKVLHHLEPLTFQYYDDFSYCQECDQVFWKGSHYDKMKESLIDFVLTTSL